MKAVGLLMIGVGYALVYWGRGHFQDQTRYSLYELLGFGTLIKGIQMQPGTPIQFKS